MKLTKFLFPLVCLAPFAFSQQAGLSPSALAFAPAVANPAGSSRQTEAITLTNTGNSDLVVSSVTASGGYLQTNDCSTVSPGHSCTVEVTFNPGMIGVINGAITVSDNAPSSPQVVSLVGTGLSPVQLTPGKTNFGTVAVGSTSQPHTLTLTAAPNSGFSINQISVSGGYSQTNNCPSSLQDGQSCKINVVFRPTVSAPVNGAIAVSGTVQNVAVAFSTALTGTGSGKAVSQVSVQPASLNFGNKGLDLVDTVKELTVTNTSSNTSLSIQGISLSGSPNALGAFPMYKINSSTCSGMLAPGAQCKVEAAFSTSALQLFPLNRPGALTIMDSDPAGPQVVGISGNEVGELTFSPATVVFPPQPVGTTTQKTVRVTGNDTEHGLVLDIATSGDFAATGNLLPCFLTPGGTCMMTVSFTPTQKGVINGAVTLETYPQCNPDPRERHHCSQPLVLNLSGTGQ